MGDVEFLSREVIDYPVFTSIEQFIYIYIYIYIYS